MARLYTLLREMARISLVLLLFAGVASPLAAQKPAAPPRDFPIDSIAVEGNRIPAAAIVQASGLKRGETGNSYSGTHSAIWYEHSLPHLLSLTVHTEQIFRHVKLRRFL